MDYQKQLERALELYKKSPVDYSVYGQIVAVDFVTGEVATPAHDPKDPAFVRKNFETAKQIIHRFIQWKTKDDPVVVGIYAQNKQIKKYLDGYLNKLLERKGLKNELRMAQSPDGGASDMTRKEMKPVKQEPKPIAIEASSLMIWDIQYDIEDKVLVGYSLENAEWVDLIYSEHRANFVYQDEVYDMDDFIRL